MTPPWPSPSRMPAAAAATSFLETKATRLFRFSVKWSGGVPPLASDSAPSGRGFSRHEGLPIRCVLGKARKANFRAPHRLDEPTKLSLGAVASLQSLLPFRGKVIVALRLMQLPAGAFAAAGELRPACDPAPRGSPPDARPACRPASRNQCSVQPHRVVPLHVLLNQSPRILRC